MRSNKEAVSKWVESAPGRGPFSKNEIPNSSKKILSNAAIANDAFFERERDSSEQLAWGILEVEI